ncbi:polysaccharide deacetylase family protein [Pseudonocardia aurantiaca]|uniref:Polysaccharide deacetylase family protein n=1 Tax=Pseudonocardia aurantiaca TaxID=75290 RepID=A0ABW4FCP6_9PSEU
MPAPRPGPSQLLDRGPADGPRARIALTIDDGTCADCVAGYGEFAQRSGTHLTFSPNGVLDGAWRPQARALAPLIATGHVQMINHTWSHPRLSTLPEAKVREELERNDEWVVKLFGVTTRPYYRPPFGERDTAVDTIAGSLGYTRSVQWSGSYGDSLDVTPEFLMEQARKSFWPGAIVLGHANRPTVLGLFDELLSLLRQRRLEPVTLDEMFGTSRAVGA